MDDKWIYLPEGGYPENRTKVHVLVLSRCRDPYHDKGKPGKVYVTTAFFQRGYDGERNWFDVILDDDVGYEYVNEYDSCEDYEPQEEHPDSSYDSYIVAWQPMPKAPENIVWPERKPMRRWRKVSKCPACEYEPPKDADPDEIKFCPRCGRQMRMDYAADPDTYNKE